MIAYKFLSSGRVGLFSGVRWPEPGTWLEADAEDVERCGSGIHALHAEGLLGWIDDELWTCELAGIVEDDGQVLVAQRGRLLEQRDGLERGRGPRLLARVRGEGREHVVEALRMEGYEDEAREARGPRRRGLRDGRARARSTAAGGDRRSRAHGRRHDGARRGSSPRGPRAAAALAPRGRRRRAALRMERSPRTWPSSSPTRRRASTRRDTRPGSPQSARGSSSVSSSDSVSSVPPPRSADRL